MATGCFTTSTVTDTLIYSPHEVSLQSFKSIYFADFLVLSGNFGRKDVGWSGGNFDCDDEVDFADFLELSKNFDAR